QRRPPRPAPGPPPMGADGGLLSRRELVPAARPASLPAMKKQEQQRSRVLTRRALVVAGGQAVLLSALAGRLYYLQVVESDKYTTLAEDNRVNLRLLAPPRGLIVDRFGVPLAVNRQMYRVVMIPEQAGEIEKTLDAIGTLVQLTDADRRRVMRRS